MANVFIVLCFILCIFAIMGVNLFKGLFFYCSNPTDQSIEVVDQETCESAGGLWINTQMNFDNSPRAFLTLFESMTTEGWLNPMFSAIDSTEIGKAPVQNNKVYFSVYFCCFMVIGHIFMLNLFVGVIIDNFNKIKDKEEVGGILVTEHQRNWIKI